MGFEPMIRVLQTLALPLGHVAVIKRAGDGTRTHDLLLGKETFYQLNYTRITCLLNCVREYSIIHFNRQPDASPFFPQQPGLN